MYHLPHVCYTLVPEIYVHPKMLCVFRYIEVLTCVIYNCMHSIEHQGQTLSVVKTVIVFDIQYKT